MRPLDYAKNTKGATGKRAVPLRITKRSNRNLGRLGGYFFLFCRNKLMIPTTKMPIWIRSEYVTICITPLRCSGGGSKKCGLLPKEGPPPTAYWQRQRISMRQGHCGIICRIWQELIGSLSHGCAVPAPPEGEPRLYLSLRGAQRRGNP